jgi:hypothetical protein
MAAGLMSDDAEKVQRIGMVGLRREDLAIEPLRVRQSAGLVVLKCDLKRLWNRHSLESMEAGAAKMGPRPLAGD